MRYLNDARDLLARRGIWNREMAMVLYAMLVERRGYTEALLAYVEFDGRSRTEIERLMDEAAGMAGWWAGARFILEECYREGSR